MRRNLIYQSAGTDGCEEGRTAWIGFTPAARSTRRRSAMGRRCFCFTRCCRTARASTPIAPELVAIVSRDRSGIAGLWPLAGGRRRPCRCRRPHGGSGRRMPSGGQAPIVLGNGYGGFVALQMAIRHPGIAARFVFADCGAAFSEPGRAGLPQHGRRPRRRRGSPRSPMSRCAGCSRRNSRRSIRT